MINRTPYNISRNDIKSGDIIFIRGTKKLLLDRLIMLFTGDGYTHVGIACWVKDDILNISRLMMVDIQGFSKLRIINLSAYSEFDIDVMECPSSWSEIGHEVLRDVATIKYNWWHSIYIGFQELFIRHNIKIIKLPKLNFKDDICSKFVARIFKLGDTHLSPLKLFKELESRGHKIKVHIKGSKY